MLVAEKKNLKNLPAVTPKQVNVTHVQLTGATGSGKTWFAKQAFAEIARRSDAEFIIYSPVDVNGWPARASIYTDVGKWVKAIEDYKKSSKRAAYVYCDEFGEVDAHYNGWLNYPYTIKTLCSLGRHFGITAWLAAQRPTMIPPSLRNNCVMKVCFRLIGMADAKSVEDESPVKTWNGKQLRQALLELPKLTAFMVQGMKFRQIHIGKHIK